MFTTTRCFPIFGAPRRNPSPPQYSLLERLDDEFSRMKLASTALAGSVYVQDFLAEREYGAVTVSQVAGTNLFAAAAITKSAQNYAERLFIVVSASALILLLGTLLFLYRALSSKMVRPMLETTETMRMGLLNKQISAHFIVNTIDCIESLSEQGENQKAAAAARNLAGMLRDAYETDEWDYEEYRLKGVALLNIQKRIRALWQKIRYQRQRRVGRRLCRHSAPALY